MNTLLIILSSLLLISILTNIYLSIGIKTYKQAFIDFINRLNTVETFYKSNQKNVSKIYKDIQNKINTTN